MKVKNLDGKEIPDDKIDFITKKARNIFDQLIELCNNDDLVPWWNRDAIYNAVDAIDGYLQNVLNRSNQKQIELDGKSSEWICHPVNTLRKKNLTHVIDVVRALKSEGFKNILISVCNPGHVKLPADLRSSLNFKVTMGLYDVMKEDYIIHENIVDDIKSFISNIMDYLQKFKIQIKKLIDGINGKVYDLIKKRFKDTKKLNRPGNVRLLSINDGKCKYIEISYIDSKQLQDHVTKSNRSIIQLINHYMTEEDRYIRKLDKSKSIFESVKFI